MINLLACPFCAQEPDIDDPDTCHPTGSGWKERSNGLRSYHSYREVPEKQWCWEINCPVTSGGCGASISADSKEEVILKWNTRAHG